MNVVNRGRSRLLAAAAAVILLVAAGLTTGFAVRGQSLTVRDKNWQQDISYLARELPRVHVDGLTSTSASAWNAAATRLQAAVPRLTNGQVIVGMSSMVAMLHDDETWLLLPPSPVFPFAGQWIGNGLYLIAAPAADRKLLGGQLIAINGHPIGDVLARIRPEIDYQDPGVARASEIGWDDISTQSPGYLNNADLLHWLGLTRSAATADFTVRTLAGLSSIRLSSTGPGGGAAAEPAIAYLPFPLYLQHADEPYWMQVLGPEHAVYLKYNQCLSNDGFQQLAARALAAVRQHPGYRLIVDLRDNGGGASGPFGALIAGIVADPSLNQPGRIFGLVNDLTDSSASLDATALGQQTQALLIGQQAADPVDEFGDDSGLLKLPHYGICIQYTTAVVNPNEARMGIPDIIVAPTQRDWLTGTDPVLAAALSYGRTG